MDTTAKIIEQNDAIMDEVAELKARIAQRELEIVRIERSNKTIKLHIAETQASLDMARKILARLQP